MTAETASTLGDVRNAARAFLAAPSEAAATALIEHGRSFGLSLPEYAVGVERGRSPQVVTGWARDILAEPPGPVHVCEVSRETATRPNYRGQITVTGWCDCGRAVTIEQDSIL